MGPGILAIKKKRIVSFREEGGGREKGEKRHQLLVEGGKRKNRLSGRTSKRRGKIEPTL